MKDAIDFLDRIEGHGYGGTADYEVARTTVRDGAAEIERLRADAESLREWIREALHELSDPCDACDFGDNELPALRATVDNAIGKLSTAIGIKQKTPATLVEAKAKRDARWPD